MKRASAKSIVVAAICGIVMSVFSAGTASAKEYNGLVISPGSIEIELSPSEVYRGKYTLTNDDTESRTVKIQAAPYTVINSNYGAPSFDDAGKYSQMGQWIKPGVTDMTLAPGETRDINYSIVVPSNPPAGTQYGSVLVVHEPIGDSGVIKPTTRLSYIITAQMRGGQTNDRSNISSHNIAGYQPTSPLKASFAVKNEGNVSTTTKYTMTVKNAINGTEVYNSGEQQGSVYPESTRSFEVKWKGMGVGFYNVGLKISLNGRDHTINQFVVAVPIWIFALIGIGILCLVGYAILNYRMVKKARAGKK